MLLNSIKDIVNVKNVLGGHVKSVYIECLPWFGKTAARTEMSLKEHSAFSAKLEGWTEICWSEYFNFIYNIIFLIEFFFYVGITPIVRY